MSHSIGDFLSRCSQRYPDPYLDPNSIKSNPLKFNTWLMFDLVVEVSQGSTFSLADLPDGSAIVVADVVQLAMLMLMLVCCCDWKRAL